MINRRSLPRNCELFTDDNMQFNTTAGTFKSSQYVFLHDISLPEFSYTRKVSRVKAYLFDADNVEYDIIFGRRFLNQVKIDVRSSDLTCKWFEDIIPFHSRSYFKNNEAIRKVLTIDPARVAMAESHIANVTETKATFADPRSIADAQTHLTPEQRDQLYEVLKSFPTLFSGKLGTYPHREFHIQLKPNAVPYHCKQPYPVPLVNQPVLKAELQRQCEIGILAKCGATEWGMPLLVIPKKDGAIRTVDDLRELNKQIVRKKYMLPKIQDIFYRRRGYRYFTKIDLTLCFYTYKLDEASTWLCVLVTPFGKYRRLRLPMGCTQSPDWAQECLEEVLHDLLHVAVECYIDDVGIFSNSWDDHIKTIKIVLQRLQDNGYTVNPAKCEWAVKETDWLVHWLTPTGIKPWKKRLKVFWHLMNPRLSSNYEPL